MNTKGDEVSFWADDNFWELDGGDGFTTLTVLNATESHT